MHAALGGEYVTSSLHEVNQLANNKKKNRYNARSAHAATLWKKRFYFLLAIQGGIVPVPNASVHQMQQCARAANRRMHKTLYERLPNLQRINGIPRMLQFDVPNDFDEILLFGTLHSRVYQIDTFDQALDIVDAWEHGGLTLQSSFTPVSGGTPAPGADLGRITQEIEDESFWDNMGDVFTPRSEDGTGFFADILDGIGDFFDFNSDGRIG